MFVKSKKAFEKGKIEYNHRRATIRKCSRVGKATKLITDTTTICRCSGIARNPTTQKSLIIRLSWQSVNETHVKYFAFYLVSANLAKTVRLAAQN